MVFGRYFYVLDEIAGNRESGITRNQTQTIHYRISPVSHLKHLIYGSTTAHINFSSRNIVCCIFILHIACNISPCAKNRIILQRNLTAFIHLKLSIISNNSTRMGSFSLIAISGILRTTNLNRTEYVQVHAARQSKFTEKSRSCVV